MGDLSQAVGANQKRLRNERGLSLDALAKASGVSRSRLAQIESGDANPSITTVWQIASALKVGFAELVTEETSGRSHVARIYGHEPSASEDGSYRAHAVFPFDPTVGFELYACELDAGGRLSSAPHHGGTQETLTVHQGVLEVIVGDERYSLSADEAVRFPADQPHEYRNPGDVTTLFSTIVAYSRPV